MDFLDIILNTTYTSEAAFRRLGLLKQYLEAVTYQYAVAPSVDAYFEGREQPDDVQVVATWIRSFPESNTDTFYERIEEVERALSRVPVLVLYTPVAITGVQQDELSVCVRESVNAAVLVDYRVDPAAVGGCCFVWDGRYCDFSLTHYLAGQQQVITSYFDHHV